MPGIPFVITQAKKAGLRVCGLSDEQIRELTPQEAEDILAAAESVRTDAREVREFVETYVAQARAATAEIKQPSILNMVLVNPADNDVTSIYRYALDDPSLAERMTSDAVNASRAGHNVYVEGRTVRQGFTGKERGKLEDTVALFALVVDSDADKGIGWQPTVPVSLAVETSPGNAHYWFFLEQAVNHTTGQKLGERLRAATGADSNTGVVTQPYRVAGTVNYPSKKKLARGRTNSAATRVMGFDPETLWSPELFDLEFPPGPEGGNGQAGDTAADIDESTIPAETLEAIKSSEKGGRGNILWNVAQTLCEDGWTTDGIIKLLQRYPGGLANKFKGRLRREVERTCAKLVQGGPNKQPTPPANITLLTPQTRFLDGFVPPEYIVDGVLQRRFLYSLTGVTGGGKTAIALALARAIGCADPKTTFGRHAVEKGTAVYFVGENPDDVRARLIGTNALRGDDPSTDQIHYIVGVFDIEKIRARLIAEIKQIGGIDLVIIDTSAAYFLNDDENSNPQIGAHARVLRSLTTLPGGPCVVALCHPIKHASDRSHLLPRGGGAFLAEVDGNLTAWRHGDDLIELHHGDKFRGPGFEPITFRIEKITTPKLVDSKGREIPTIHAVAISEAEEEREAGNVQQEEDRLLAELLANPNRSVADLARACGFTLANGEPHKSKLHRRLSGLEDDKLIKNKRRRWVLTDEGKAAAEKLKQAALDEMAEARGGKTGSKLEFFAAVGKKVGATVPCCHCGNADGNVYKIKDGRLAEGKGHAESLHQTCAKAWFEGKSSG